MAPGPAQLQAAGAQPSQAALGAPLYHNRFKMGLWTQRNPLRDPSGVVTERWYGGGTDALLDGLNVEVTNRLTLARAAGSTSFSNQTLAAPPASFYSFKQFTGNSETIWPIVDTATTVYWLTPTSKGTILTKAAFAGAAYFVGIAGNLYMCDGVENKVWEPIGQTTTKWGVSAANAILNAGIQGKPGTGANGGAPGTAWVNPNNISAPGGQTTVTLAAGASSQQLKGTNCGFSVANSSPVFGMRFQYTGKVSTGSVQLAIQLLNAGQPVGSVRHVLLNATAFTNLDVGASLADLWGFQWTQAALASTTFGFQIQATNLSGSSITVTLGDGAASQPVVTPYISSPVTTNNVAGTLTATVGYKYVAAFGKSKRGVVSTGCLACASTGPLGGTTVQVGFVNVGNSLDSEVDQLWLFRTKDGGSVYYNVPGSPLPIGTGTYNDQNVDSQLGSLQLADLQPQDGGQALNTPPQYGLVAPEVHFGRVWGGVGNIVYYSAGPDLGLIVGNGNESFPAANFFTFPSLVTRLLSVSTVDNAFLLVFTVSDVYAIYGNASAAGVSTGVSGLTQFYPVPFLKRVGLLNYWALDVRGTQIYMFTNDKRLIRFNPSSQVIFLDPEKAIEEIGFPIGAPPTGVSLTGGTLDSFTPSSAFVSWHGAGSGDQALYVADGATGWFRGNINQQPDGGICWSAKRNITGGCGPVQSIETSPGVFQLLLGTSNSVLYRDVTSFSDVGSGYSAFGRLGAFVLAQPGQEANVPFVTADFVNTGSEPTVGVLFSELDGSFVSLSKSDNDPPHSAAPATIKANRYYTRQASSGSQAPNTGRYMQLKVDFGSDTVQNEMLSLTVFGGFEQEH